MLCNEAIYNFVPNIPSLFLSLSLSPSLFLSLSLSLPLSPFLSLSLTVPRPNIFIYISPIHVNFHQEQCLWLAEFAHGVAQTVNLDLLLSAHSEGQHLLQELKAKRDVVNKLNGVDMKFYLPYSKVRIKLNKTAPSVME